MTLVHRLAAISVLVAFWLLLYGEANIGNVAAGLIAAVAVTSIFPLTPASRTHRIHPIATARLALHFAGLVAVSNVELVRTILRPRPSRLRAGIVRIDLGPTTPLVTALVANALSLTPGNLTITADDRGVLHVHILGLTTPEQVRAETLDLHRRVLAAIRPRPESGPK